MFIENRIKEKNELKRTDTEDIKLTRSIEFKVFPVKWVINYNFTEAKQTSLLARWKKDSSKGNTEMYAFSRIRDNPNVQSETQTIQKKRTNSNRKFKRTRA